MKRQMLFISVLIFAATAFANQSVKLSPKQIELIFLEQNLQLIARQMDIGKADAALVQAKLWENPGLSISDVSFWSTRSQRDGEAEVIPPLFGSAGKNTQFSIELSQLIQTANKRKKRVDREKASKEISIQEFEELVRGLKAELRNSMIEIQYFQEYREILNLGKQSVSQLIDAYSRPAAKGNSSAHELLRLQSALFEIESEVNALQTELNARKKELKIWLNVDPATPVELEYGPDAITDVQELSLTELMNKAVESRPDVKASRSQIRYHEKALAYEKAQRVPDLNLSANYDRGGGVWKDFVGVGIGFDLPVFNRNQGAIKAARIEKEQSELLALQQQRIVQHEVAEAYENYALTYRFYEKTIQNPLFSRLDDMLETYSKNLLNKNISMLEYIDFIDSYKTTKQNLLTLRKDLNRQFEELQYAIGTDIK